MLLGRIEDEKEDTEEDELTKPQGQRPLPKWVKKILDSKELPAIEEASSKHRQPLRGTFQRLEEKCKV